MTPPEELKPLPCPWCGVVPKIYAQDDEITFAVECWEPFCPGHSSYGTRAQAIEGWNTRGEHEAKEVQE